MDAGIDQSAAMFPDPVTGWLLSGSDRVADQRQSVGTAERVGPGEFGISWRPRTEMFEARIVADQ